MRRQFIAFLTCTAVAAAFYSAAAFSAASTGARTVTATVVGDSAAYLQVSSNGAGAHKSFVSTTGSPAKIVIDFASATGVTGTGINPDSTYHFDDLLNITNAGTSSVSVRVNATSTSGVVQVCYKATTGQMANSCYSTSAGPLTLAVGGTDHVGISVNATGATGGTVSGSIFIVATRA